MLVEWVVEKKDLLELSEVWGPKKERGREGGSVYVDVLMCVYSPVYDCCCGVVNTNNVL